MGGDPRTAMNIVCFPDKEMPIEVLNQILAGGLSMMTEAGVALVGGHSVRAPELKYGLSVTGFVHPDHILANGDAKAGDKLVITKGIGTGIIGTAIKRREASAEAEEVCVTAMTTLNRWPSEEFTRAANGCTDITGFGLLGHSWEMIADTELSLVLNASEIPLLTDTMKLAEAGFLPGGIQRNVEFYEPHVDIADGVSDLTKQVFYDPQTAGGLLISIPPDQADELVAAMREDGKPRTAIVGEVIADGTNSIHVRA
jgi:selenide, water dikinase